MVEGDSFLEGISLRDESYDGFGSKWDRRVDPSLHPPKSPSTPHHNNLLTILHAPDQEEGSEDTEVGSEDEESFQLSPRQEAGPNSSTTTSPPYLTKGLGQLTDKIEGASAFTMDIGYGLGKLPPWLSLSSAA